MPMHDSVRDQVLHAMTLEGWFTESTGDVESPTGWFAWTWNEANELESIKQAFGDDQTIEGLDTFDWAEVQGAWVLIEKSDGFIQVMHFETRAKAQDEYNRRLNQYLLWSDGDDDDAFQSNADEKPVNFPTLVNDNVASINFLRK